MNRKILMEPKIISLLAGFPFLPGPLKRGSTVIDLDIIPWL